MRLVAVSAGLIFLSTLVFGQANVPEQNETAFLYVDGTNGNDSNPGTQQLPLQTIGAAVAIAVSNNKASIGTQINVNPGTYRESISLTEGYAATSLPITLQAVTNGTVTVTGSTQYTSWNVYTGNSNIYTTTWPYQWGYCVADADGAPLEEPIVLRQEEVVVNGALLTQVLDLTSMVFPGTFYVDETGGTMYVWPPTGTNMGTADVEVATQPSVLNINQSSNVVVRGITFTHASSCHNAAAVNVYNSNNVLFDTVTSIWNNGQGIAMNYPTYDVTYLNTTTNHNGSAGIQMYQVLNVLWQDVSTSYNNWRGAQGVYYVWNAGGAHVFSDHNETFNNYTATYNQSFPLHWDTDGINISVNNMYAVNNFLGLFDEKNQGPITVSNSTFCGGQTGVTLRNGTYLTLMNNVFYNNSNAQVYVTGVAGGIMITDWATGQNLNLIGSYLTMTNNTFDAPSATEYLFKDAFLGGSDWNTFLQTLDSNDNDWWAPNNPTPFMVPVPSLSTSDSYATWLSLTGQDSGSTWAQPATDPSIACTAAVDAPDWWLTLNSYVGTQTAGTGVFTTDNSGNVVIPISTESLGGWTGTITLAVDGVSSIPGATATFNPPTLTANSTTNLTFSAGVTTPAGTYTFVVLANSGSVTRSVTLNVTVPVITMRLSTTSLNFGNQAVNFSSSPQTVTLTNYGTKAITNVSVTSTYGYTPTNGCGTSIAAGKSCTVTVVFKPTQVQTYSGALTITDSDPSSPQTVSLTGVGTGSAKGQLSVHNLAFTGTVFESASKPLSVTVTNIGTAPMTLSPVTFTGANGGDLTTNLCTQTIPINGSCTYTVVFTPTTVGKESATMNMPGNQSNSPLTLSVTGTGLTAIKVSPNSLNFGTVSVGKSGAAKTITISNLSTATLSMSPLKVIGADPQDFVLSANSCSSSLAGNSSCSVTVTYTPTTGGSRSASLSIVDGDPTSPQSATFTGSADAISVSPTTVNYGNVTSGNSQSKTVTVTNAGTSPVTMSPLQISGTNAANFTMSGNTCGSSLAASSSCSVSITFAPPSPGSYSATLTVTDSDLSSPTKVSLTGTGK
jgi:hypothetical protein